MNNLVFSKKYFYFYVYELYVKNYLTVLNSEVLNNLLFKFTVK